MVTEGQEGLAVIVGAGPGQPGLITTAGADWLARADTIVHDRLAGTELLKLAGDQAQLIYAGKTPGGKGLSQEQINELLIRQCKRGKLVVRLKGGDPMVFGRGGEEAEALAQAGCSYRLVPGISAALATSSGAGIPLTDRRVASTVAFVTGHEDPSKEQTSIDWHALAKIDTVVFYMSVATLPNITKKLIAAGRDPATPAAAVENGGSLKQRTIMAQLGTITDQTDAAGLHSPAVIIVGHVVELRNRIAWLEKLPLFGKTVLVTRPEGSNESFCRMLQELGAEAIGSPTKRVAPLSDYAELDEALTSLGRFDWLVLTSANGVKHTMARLEHLHMDARNLAGLKIAVIGPATAQALRQWGINADLISASATSKSLGQSLASQGQLAGKRILLPRANEATEALPVILRDSGAIVEDIAAYRTARLPSLPVAALDALTAGTVDWIAFTSRESMCDFFALCPEGHLDTSKVKLAAIGPVTADAMRARSLTPTVTASPHTIEALVEGIVRAELAD